MPPCDSLLQICRSRYHSSVTRALAGKPNRHRAMHLQLDFFNGLSQDGIASLCLYTSTMKAPMMHEPTSLLWAACCVQAHGLCWSICGAELCA